MQNTCGQILLIRRDCKDVKMKLGTGIGKNMKADAFRKIIKIIFIVSWVQTCFVKNSTLK